MKRSTVCIEGARNVLKAAGGKWSGSGSGSVKAMCDDGDEDEADSTGMPCGFRQRVRKKITRRALCYSGHEEVDMI